jgi:zinc transporter 9
MEDYLLETDDLDGLPVRTFRNPNNEFGEVNQSIICYLKSDVERRALEVWGSWNVLEQELNSRRHREREEEKRRQGKAMRSLSLSLNYCV